VAKVLGTHRTRLLGRGIDAQIVAALVRDSTRQRDGVERSRITRDASVFLGADFDLAIEVLGGVEPAQRYVSDILRRGIPVVTANKSLLAAAGGELRTLAQQHGTSLLCEASALAGVPILGPLGRRPLAAGIERIAGIVNGTSNFILSRVAEAGVPIADALREAQALGFAEPNASNDVLGVDAAEKLVVLLQQIGIRGIRAGQIETRGILELSPADLAAAREFGGAIKPVVAAEIAAGRVEAFVGPAFVTEANPLSRVTNEQNGIRFSGALVGELFYSGPGAGPDVTAATIVDDVVEAVSSGPRVDAPDLDGRVHAAIAAPPSGRWLVRLRFEAQPAGRSVTHIVEFLAARGVWVQRSLDARAGSDRDWYALTHECSATRLDAALADLHVATKCETYALRVLEN
jgi:homoserine dehydrogenase